MIKSYLSTIFIADMLHIYGVRFRKVQKVQILWINMKIH